MRKLYKHVTSLGFDELFSIYHNEEEKDLNICPSKITSLPFQPLIILFNINPRKVVWTEGVLIAFKEHCIFLK